LKCFEADQLINLHRLFLAPDFAEWHQFGFDKVLNMFESAARNDDFCMSTFFRSCFEARSQIDFITDYRQIFAPTAADIAEQNCSGADTNADVNA